MILGRSSPQSLYKQDLVSMDVEGGFDVALSEGFIKTNVSFFLYDVDCFELLVALVCNTF
jgi:hypothetical protein